MDEERRVGAIRTALELHTGSLRALAREAGLSHRYLMMLRDGDRRPTETALEAIADALDRITARNAEAARTLRDVLTEEEGGD